MQKRYIQIEMKRIVTPGISSEEHYRWVLHFAANTVQSISASLPYFMDNHSFAFLKWPLPKKPL